MKKTICLLLAAVMAAGTLFSCAGSNSENDSGQTSGDSGITTSAESGDATTADAASVPEGNIIKDDDMATVNEIKEWLGYIPKLAAPDGITVIQNFADNGDKLLALSLQGITARTKPVLCTSGANSDKWIAAIKEQVNPDLPVDTISDVWAALEKFGDMVPRKEYVVYDDNSVNSASTIAAAEGILIASESNRGKLDAIGYKMFADARGLSDADAIRQYKDKLNLYALVQQVEGNYALRDFGIAYGFGFYMYDGGIRKEIKEAEEIHNYIDEGGIVFGWGPGDEYQHVKTKANHGLITIPSDHAWNLSLFSAFPREQMTQINDYAAGVEAVDGKHYIALVMTDGDNVQWMVNDFASPNWFGNADRGSIPMAWMIPPTLLDVAPQTMKWIFGQQTENDVYMNALSGTGYFYPEELTEEAMDKQIEKLSFYMNACDFDTITIMDNNVPSRENLDKYASIDKLKGGVLFTYPDYYKGAKGKIYWSGDKPFISVKNSIWSVDIDDFVKSTESAIKKSGYDITTEGAYSVIVLHCWSHTYSDAVSFAKKLSALDENVEFVRVDQIVKLVADNVKH